MSRFNCTCGFEIRDITCPSTHEGYLVTDLELDDHYPPQHSIDVQDSRAFLECPNCWRLWVQSGLRGTWHAYSPDGEPLKLSERQGGYRG